MNFRVRFSPRVEEPEAFVALKQDILPQLLADKPEGYVFRVWVTGCATGEEAYSIAMLLREFMDETRQEFKVQLYSTTVNLFSSPRTLAGEGWGRGSALELEVSSRVFPLPNPLPQVGEGTKQRGLFVNINQSVTGRTNLPCPASVITDLSGNILYVHGDTGKYLRPAPGRATLNIVEMAREGLQLELCTALLAATSPDAAKQSAPIQSKELPIKTDGDFQFVSFSVRPLPGPDRNENLLLVSFQDVAQAPPGKAARGKKTPEPVELQRIEELERELAYSKENLQAIIEEHQAANEELKSTNEELQSTNEELETSKEELQSLNEELITVNAELQAKIEQLFSMQNNMKNLLDNVSVGTIFLDQHLIIRRYTREAAQVYRLVASDVGRALGDIKSNIEGDDLLADAQAVLNTLVPCEREVHTVGGTWYLARIQPYRTLDNVIDGVVLTFNDITGHVRAEAAVREARELAEGIVDTVREPLLVLDAALQVVSASRSFYLVFKVSAQKTVGRSLFELENHQWDIPALRELLESILPRNQSFEDYPVELDFPATGKYKMQLNARRIIGKASDTQLILLAMEDVTDRGGNK